MEIRNLMQGAPELAEQIFGMPVRVGNPITLGGLVEEYRSPIYATGVGLVLLGAESLAPEERREASRPEKSESSVGRLLDWLKHGFF